MEDKTLFNDCALDEQENSEYIEYESRRMHKKYAPLIDVINKSGNEYRDVLKREMYLHSEKECSCYYANTCCLVGEFVEKHGSVYDMNSRIERLIERKQLHRYTGFEIPVIEDTEENEGEFLFYILGGAESCYLGAYSKIETAFDFMKKNTEMTDELLLKCYDTFCEDNKFLSPYSIACAIGLEEGIAV